MGNESFSFVLGTFKKVNYVQYGTRDKNYHVEQVPLENILYCWGADSPEPPLLAFIRFRCRYRLTQTIRRLALIRHNGHLKEIFMH